jgi:iron complex transport system permease protein
MTDWIAPVGFRARRWHRWGSVMLLGLLVLAGGYLMLGLDNVLSPAALWRAITAPDDVPLVHRVAVETRVPRLLLCLFAGAALAAAGALLQALTRNPIASPDLTGVTAGAVAGAVAWIAFAPPTAFVSNVWARPAAATAGGLAAAGVVYLLTRRSNGMESMRLLLIGVMVSGVLTSATTLGLLFLGPQATNVLGWLSGSVALRTWTDVAIIAVYLVPGLLLTLLAIGRANALQLGEDVARSLGQGRELDRLIVLVAAVVLTAGVVSVLGGIGFVGLMAPHMVRGLVGSDLRRQIPAAALAGAAMMVLADMIARNVNSRNLFAFLGDDLSARPLPAGVVITLFGVPYLASLLWRQKS